MIADLLWSAATSDLALAGLGVLALAAGAVAILPARLLPASVAPYVLLARVSFCALLFVFGLLSGHRMADERAEAARLKIDLAFQRAQLDAQRAAAEDAARLRREAEARAHDLDRRVADYEAKLSAAPSGACDLDERDVDGLRGIAR